MPTAGFALAPTNFEEAYRIAQMLSQSAFVPASYRGKPNDCSRPWPTVRRSASRPSRLSKGSR